MIDLDAFPPAGGSAVNLAAHPGSERERPPAPRHSPLAEGSVQGWQALRGELLTFIDDPAVVLRSGAPIENAYRHIEDGLVVFADGLIQALGSARDLLPCLPTGVPVEEYQDALILPGLIDTHAHFPQLDVMASHGASLLDWLRQYTFPVEARFADQRVAAEAAEFFLREMLRCGTTTAMVFGSVHPQSVEAFFRQSERFGTRMICGKVMMDCNAPAELLDTADGGAAASADLIATWHGRGRQLYAITPRFAVTSSDRQLQLAGELLAAHPDVYLQTHVAENREELALVKRQHPRATGYLDAYARHGLLTPRSVLAHGIHLQDDELSRLAQADSTIAFCPTSNLFLGSGLLDLGRLERAGVNVCLATDIGAGTSFSMLRTLDEAYKVTRFAQGTLSPLRAFYLATLGNARALRLESRIGTLEPGTEADAVVLDWHATPLLQRRLATCRSLAERLFALLVLGDDRATLGTWVAGRCVYRRGS